MQAIVKSYNITICTKAKKLVSLFSNRIRVEYLSTVCISIGN